MSQNRHRLWRVGARRSSSPSDTLSDKNLENIREGQYHKSMPAMPLQLRSPMWRSQAYNHHVALSNGNCVVVTPSTCNRSVIPARLQWLSNTISSAPPTLEEWHRGGVPHHFAKHSKTLPPRDRTNQGSTIIFHDTSAMKSHIIIIILLDIKNEVDTPLERILIT